MSDKIIIEYKEEILWDTLTEREQRIFNAGVDEGERNADKENRQVFLILLGFVAITIIGLSLTLHS
jgi:hypothetical protein